jgi:hypothetical protein
MSSIVLPLVVHIGLSDKARTDHAVATGVVYSPKTRLEMPFTSFSESTRTRLLDVLGLPSELDRAENGRLGYFLTWVPTGGVGGVDNSFAAPIVPQSEEDWIKVAEAYSARRQEVVAQLETMQAERREHDAAERERRSEQVDAQLARMEALDDEKFLTAYGDGDTHLRIQVYTGEQGGRLGSLQKRLDMLVDARRAKQEIAARRREADRSVWIAEHGSDYLKRATAQGYDCQRRYITERAELEHPGYMVDFDSRAAWKDRTCPSETALDLAEKDHGSVVWLTDPPFPPYDPENGETWEPCEAVVIDFLGYDLIRIFRPY